MVASKVLSADVLHGSPAKVPPRERMAKEVPDEELHSNDLPHIPLRVVEFGKGYDLSVLWLSIPRGASYSRREAVGDTESVINTAHEIVIFIIQLLGHVCEIPERLPANWLPLK